MAKKKNKAAVELGKRGAKKRNENLTPEQRQEIARKAGLASGKARAKEPGTEREGSRTRKETP
jgi:general stress protein YciG